MTALFVSKQKKQDTMQFLTLLLLLAYFWYWTAATSVPNVSKPSSLEPIAPAPARYSLESNGPNLNFVVDGIVEWTVELPQETFLNEQKLSIRDDCFGQPNDSSVVATGKNLYRHLRKHDVASNRKFQVFSATDFLQNGNVFYFTCRDDKIHRLEMCPSGRIFVNGTCRKIDFCSGKPAGYAFANASSLSTFYECPGNDEPPKMRRCKDETYFLHDSCRKLQDFDVFCRGKREEIVLIDPSTRLVCRDDGRASFKKCPKGQMFFDGVCESAECLGKPDGTKIGKRQRRRGRLRYHPGYSVCRNHRVESSVECPTRWDKNSASDRAALSLPQVFDGTDCAVPKFCKNFWSDVPNAIVPVYDFAKHVRNWQYSKDVDHTVGYVCHQSGTSRKRTRVPNGHVIDGKYLKTHESLRNKTFLSDTFGAYYDRAKKFVVHCKKGEIFDGEDCRPEIENAFGHRGLGLFRMANEEWIRGWPYLNNREPIPVCTEPENVYLKTYNACFHPDCVSYPFLSQLLHSLIALEEPGHACRGESMNLVSKIRIDFHVDYWSQRRLDDEPTNEEEEEQCVPGSRIRSGHFVHDSTVYATCDRSQPFVFCPYKNTEGIILIEGKLWACKPTNTKTAILEANVTRAFQANELNVVKALHANTVVYLNGIQSDMPDEIVIEEGKPVTIRATNDILLDFRYLHTFPPDAGFKDGVPIKSNIDAGGALLMKHNGFTNKNVFLPKFSGPVEKLVGFDA